MTRYFDAEKLFKHLNTDMSKPISTDYDNGKRDEDIRIKNLIERQSTADVQPVVHAHWKYDKHGVFWCSRCECIPATKSDFCPHCGALMDEGDEYDN